jgi:hypothetical protein
VCVNQSDSLSEEPVLLQETQDLLVFGKKNGGQPLKVVQDLGSGVQIPTCDFTNDEGMGQDLSIQERLPQLCVAMPEVVYPNRGIG